jgi:hypothetical protein
MVEVYSTVLEHWNITPTGLLAHAFTHWVWYGLQGRLEKYLKSCTALLLAQVLQQEELPPIDKIYESPPMAPFGGPCRVHLRRVLMMAKRRSGRRPTRSIALAFSLYQAKAASLPVGDSFVEEELDNAVDRLTTEYPLGPEMDTVRELLFEAIDDTVDSLFSGVTPTEETPRAHLIPSMRSSYQEGRKHGGAFTGLFPQSRPGGGYEKLASHFLSLPRLIGYLKLRTRVTPFYGPDSDMFNDGIEESKQRALFLNEVDCLPVGLREPFKVRVITRGDGDAYHLSRRWQQVQHRALSRHPTCNLTRSPITQFHLDHLTNNLSEGGRAVLDGRTSLISGDYKAATDFIDPELSCAALDRIALKLGIPFLEHRSLRLALSGHRIHRSSNDAGLPQKWGQLMGSPVSFPILCIINLAATRLAMDMGGHFGPWRSDIGGRSMRKLNEYPILINGDDVGFEATPVTYSIWKWVTAAAGLRFSLGKNYSSQDFLILNSQIFSFVPQIDFFGDRVGRLWRLHHLEVGLLYGQVKGSSTTEREESTFVDSPFLDSARSLTQMAHDLVRPWSLCQRDRLMTKFLEVHGSTLRTRIPDGMSWWLPRHLGGLGLPLTRGGEGLFSSQQLKLCAYLATRSVDDPDLGDLLEPDRPEYLGRYMASRQRAVGSLRPRWRFATWNEFLQDRGSRESAFRGLEGWAPGNVFPEASELCNLARLYEKRCRGAFRRLWIKAQGCSLQPMGADNALGHQWLRMLEEPSWV